MTKTKLRALTMLCGTTVGLVVVAAPAAAAENRKISGAFSFTDPTICVDPVRVAETYDETMHIFFDRNGEPMRLAFTGSVTIEHTDLASGNTFRPNSSGPGTIDLASGQTVIRGGNGAFFDAQGRFVATSGRTILDADGNVISMVGRSVDVCTMLGTSPR